MIVAKDQLVYANELYICYDIWAYVQLKTYFAYLGTFCIFRNISNIASKYL